MNAQDCREAIQAYISADDVIYFENKGFFIFSHQKKNFDGYFSAKSARSIWNAYSKDQSCEALDLNQFKQNFTKGTRIHKFT